jgi:hypothetical protein
MAAKTKDQIKDFFETGDQPTEAHFIDTIDSWVDKMGPIGEIETAASAGNTGFAYCSGGNGEIVSPNNARDLMGITVFTTALVTQIISGTSITTAAASAAASEAIAAAYNTTAQGNTGTLASGIMNPVLVRNAIEGNRATGQTINRSYVTSFSGGISSITGSSIPVDNTTPLIGEGTELFTTSITPSSASSRIRVSGYLYGSASAGMQIVLAAFRGSTNFGVGYQLRGGENFISFSFEDAPGSTSALTYSLRCGITAGTLTLNQVNSATFGGSLISYMLVEEIKA